MQKRERQNILLSLIGSHDIASQSDLASRLRDEGFGVTQASVSRDLDELGVVKLDGFYSLPRRSAGGPDLGPVSFDTAGESLIIGRCPSGLASAVTVQIDAARIPEIVGTIAGDDTIFIAVTGAEAQSSALKKIADLFY